MDKSDELRNEFHALTKKTIDVVKEYVNDTKGKYIDLKDMGRSFEDDCHNVIIGVDSEKVYFNDFGGITETYNLALLSFEDAFKIIDILED